LFVGIVADAKIISVINPVNSSFIICLFLLINN